jgi:hypothetical protein
MVASVAASASAAPLTIRSANCCANAPAARLHPWDFAQELSHWPVRDCLDGYVAIHWENLAAIGEEFPRCYFSEVFHRRPQSHHVLRQHRTIAFDICTLSVNVTGPNWRWYFRNNLSTAVDSDQQQLPQPECVVRLSTYNRGARSQRQHKDPLPLAPETGAVGFLHTLKRYLPAGTKSLGVLHG